MLRKSKSRFALVFLTVFLLFFFFPLGKAEAAGVFLERERTPLVPATDGRFGSSPISPQPQQPPQTGQDGQREEEKSSNSYSPPSRTFDRGAKVFIPPASPSNPVTQPSTPPPPVGTPSVPQAPSWLTENEAKAYLLLNEFRINNGLFPLLIDYQLTEIARMKARDMVELDYFSHVSPTYGSIGQMLKSAGISFNRAAENLSKAGNVNQAHLQLAYSTQGHRQIMLSSSYNYVGIGVVPLKKTPGIVMVQLFID